MERRGGREEGGGGAQAFRTSSWTFNGCKLQGRLHACVRLRVANVVHSTLCHVDDGEGEGGREGGVTGGALTECQSHFGQTALLSPAPEASDTPIIHPERRKGERVGDLRKL